jgi:sensor histidine kinase YesM
MRFSRLGGPEFRGKILSMAQYRRSIFLINKKFQFRFAFYVCSWLFALSFVYPLIVYTLFDYFIRYAAMDPNGPPVQALQNTRHEIMMLLVLLQVVFLVVTFLISIFMSHRIAGPLYKLANFFQLARGGDLKTELYFRENDHFQDLAAQYNEMIRGIRERYDTQASTVGGAIADVERLLPSASPENRPAIENALVSLRALRR